jgi:hypothetical protein
MGTAMMRLAQRLLFILKGSFNYVDFVKAYEHDPAEQQFSDNFRAFAKGLLEFIRNLAVISAIKFFATRAQIVQRCTLSLKLACLQSLRLSPLT